MDGARIQQLVNRGYALSAFRVGMPHVWYRPTGPVSPISPASQLGTLNAAFSADDYRFAKSQPYAKALWSVLVDASQTAVGDYLVGQFTWFVAAQDPLLPVLAVQCNHALSIVRPTSNRSLGRVRGLDGDTRSAETPVMTGWPASLLQGTKGEKPDTGIPGAARDPWYAALLPAVTGVAIETDDIAIDENGNRYQISSTELTPKGWRLSMELADG